ncbi:hypothetical protein JH06_4589 [Blastocystis sp. subtype 4]|uniref:hypothetical protein n=1 Tax=Blastocystis sp. subtype 4 TaxID=944170 RepID=UPI0007115E2A|nr:hypothetical protein JH06_4589 [Blastocystis sp. subtype 4]KNB41892.1 hypothetical protein JH06_4589 [Blastocystis sp. subtype 4]|eukprot:XP_014525335.1 hypothetical protein JH06_4589 [Blastocystis sp. subtype 4]
MSSPVELKSRILAKQEFDIQGECADILNRKPKVSRNVLQAYHKEILDIAKTSKQILLDIATKKQQFVSSLLQLEDELQCAKTEEEKHFMEVSTSLDDLKKSVDLGETEKRQLQVDSCALQQQIEEKKKLKTEFNSLREKQESELAALKKEVESVSLLLEDLEKEENELKEKHASLTQSVQMEESQLEFCVPVLEEHYQKHQKDLETSITVHQQELQELKATLESSQSQHQSQLSTLNGSIQKLQSEIASLHSTTEAADCHLVAVQAEIETLCKELEKAEGELTSVNDRVLAASNDLSLLVKQKAENDEFYNKKVERAETEKSGIYQKVVDTEVKRTKLECELSQFKTEMESMEEEIQAKQKQIETIEEEKKRMEEETEMGNDILMKGDAEISEANDHIGVLDKEVTSVITELHDRNDKITTELEALAVRCEDLEDKVNEDSKGRMKEKYEIDQKLQSLESQHTDLSHTHTVLEADFNSVTDMKNSTKESGQTRIRQLQEAVSALENELNQTQSIEEEFLLQTTHLQSLEEKVQRSERARRILSDKIQTLKGNVLSEVCIWDTPGVSGSYLTDVTPDETAVSICTSSERSALCVVDHVFDRTWSEGEVIEVIADYPYAALDGVKANGKKKREFLFSDQPSSLVYQAISVLMAQTQRLASLQQTYSFSLSAVAVKNISSSSILTQNYQDVSVSESYIAEEPEVEDLLEIGRFSMDTGQIQNIRRRQVKTQEDVTSVLAMAARQRDEDDVSVIVTLTVEGICDSKRSVGQIHFCDVCGEMETVTQKQQSLIGLLPALELLFASANCQEEQKCEPSSLPNILSRLSNKGKIVAFTHVNSILQEYEETFDALSFAQLLGTCKLGPAKCRYSDVY